MVVNSTLIDNAFFGAELPIRLDRPGRLYATRPEECAVRWLVAFLLRFGSTWLAQRPRFDKCAFTFAVFHGIKAAPHVTHIEDGQQVSALPLHHSFGSHRSVYGMYKSPYKVEAHSSLPLNVCRSRLSSRIEFRLYETTMQEDILSLDKRSVLRLSEEERIAEAKIKQEHITCFVRIMDCSSFGDVRFQQETSRSPKEICMYENRFQEEDACLRRFILQLGFPSASRVDIERFAGVLPIRKNILARRLWTDGLSDAHPGLRITGLNFFQASLHLDNYIALLDDDLERAFGISLDGCLMKLCFLGCVLETVRSIVKTAEDDDIDWTPHIASSKICSIPISHQLQEGLRSIQEGLAEREGGHLPDIYIRLLCELKSGLLDQIATEEDQKAAHLVSMPETMMLMLLGFPALRIDGASELLLKADKTDKRVLAQDSVLTFVPQCGGQKDLALRLRAHLTSGRVNLEIVGAETFHWYKWKCAALKSMHRLWTVTEQKRPHLNTSELFGDTSAGSVSPWPSFYDVSLNFEELKIRARRSGATRNGRCSALKLPTVSLGFPRARIHNLKNTFVNGQSVRERRRFE